MREIKFRMWNPTGNKYIYDIDNVYECLKKQIAFDKTQDNRFGTIGYDHKSDGMVWEQFTGLKDKNGVEIYEGDIVVFYDFRGVHTNKQSVNDGYSDGWIGFIEWTEHGGWSLNKTSETNRLKLEKIGNEQEKRNAPYIYRMDNIGRCHPEVIGNIHQNPELLCK